MINIINIYGKQNNNYITNKARSRYPLTISKYSRKCSTVSHMGFPVSE